MEDKEMNENAGGDPEGGISRREWLLKLGEAAFVFGFAGSAADQPAIAGPLLSTDASGLPALPAGLYEPSGEHMAQALINESRYVKLPAGSETDYVRPREGPFCAAFFNGQEFQAIQQLLKLVLGPEPESTAQARGEEREGTIREMAEWIDLVVSKAAAVRDAAHRISPQHRALAVAYFGKEAVEKLETDDPGRVCRDGLKWLDDRSTKLHGSPFLKLDQARQIEVARSAASDLSSPTPNENAGSAFLAYLSSQTVLGWYTSRLGLKELGYKGNSFSVECPGCKPS